MTEFYRKPAIKNAFVRILIFIIIWAPMVLILELFGAELIHKTFPNYDAKSIPFKTASRGLTTLFTILLIIFFRRNVDRRPLFSRWFGITKRKTDFVTGALAGIVLIAIGAFILGQFNMVEFYPGKLELTEFLQYMGLFFVAALLEEVLFRGYILDNLLESTHPIVAVLISSVLFTLVHTQVFVQESILPALNIFLAGILLSIPFIFTKNLWFPLALHFTWNLFQGPIFGFEVSGIETKSLFNQELKHEGIWTGGKFGFEGSILATIILVIASIVIYVLFKRITKQHETN